MKMGIDTGGAEAIVPDFDVLKTGLALAQHGLPTALASAEARRAHDPFEALVRLFGDRAPAAEQQSALHGSFAPGLAGPGPDRRQS